MTGLKELKGGSHEEEWLLTNSIVFDCKHKLYIE